MGEIDYLKREQELCAKEFGTMNKRGKRAFPYWILLVVLFVVLASWITINIIHNRSVVLERLADCVPYPGTQIDGIENKIGEDLFEYPVFVDGEKIFVGEFYSNTGTIWEDKLPGKCVSNYGFRAIICESPEGNYLVVYKNGEDGKSLVKISQVKTNCDMIVSYFPYMICSSSRNPGNFNFYKYDASLIGVVKLSDKSKIAPAFNGFIATDGKSIELYEIPFPALNLFLSKANEDHEISFFPNDQSKFQRYQNAYIKNYIPKEVNQTELKSKFKTVLDNPAKDNYFLLSHYNGEMLFYDGANLNKLEFRLATFKIDFIASYSGEGLVEKKYTLESNNYYWNDGCYPAEDGIYALLFSRDGNYYLKKVMDGKDLKVVPGSTIFYSNGTITYCYGIRNISSGHKEPLTIDVKNPVRANYRGEIFDDKSVYGIKVTDVSP